MVVAIRVAIHRNHNSDDNHPAIDIGQKEGEEKNETVASHVMVVGVEVVEEVVTVNEAKVEVAMTIAIEVALHPEVPGTVTAHRVDIRREVASIVAVVVSQEVVANHGIAIATGVEVEVDQEKTKNPLQLLIHTRMNVIPR